MAEETLPPFDQALQALQNGNKEKARELLSGLIRSSPRDARLWLYMSAAVETTAEKIFCLENALKAEPDNAQALRGLSILRGRHPNDPVPNLPVIKRNWKAVEIPKPPKKPLIRRIIENPLARLVAVSAVVLLATVAVLVTLYNLRLQDQISFIMPNFTVAVPTATPTPTVTPTATYPGTRPPTYTPSPTVIGATPLWMFLEATYTPTPRYIATPHPILEAYRSAIRAYDRGDYQGMLTWFEQASREEPNSPDLSYFKAEAYRLLERWDEAIAAYEDTLERSPNFGPAYLGLALATLGKTPGANVEKQFSQAITADPNFPDVYRERALYFIAREKPESALKDVDALQRVYPTDPWVPLLRAKVLYAQGKYEQALAEASMAQQQDITLLPVYLTLAQVYLALDQDVEAHEAAEIYVRYVENDPEGWLVAGEARYRMGQVDPAFVALDRAAAMDEIDVRVYLLRGLILLERGEAQQAVNEFSKAYFLDERNFAINLGLGRALLAAKRTVDAVAQLEAVRFMVETDAETAEMLYWRGQAYEANKQIEEAIKDYRDLLDLPAEAVEAEWAEFATQRLGILVPPTITPTPTNTRMPTRTPTPTRTLQPTRTLTPTRTILPSRTPTPTRTPSPTPEP
jgi:tetratricopeptide (TPR) repeat protein